MRASCALRAARHAERLQSHHLVPVGLIALGVRRSDVEFSFPLTFKRRQGAYGVA